VLSKGKTLYMLSGSLLLSMAVMAPPVSAKAVLVDRAMADISVAMIADHESADRLEGSEKFSTE
jgi:hypothetical protein